MTKIKKILFVEDGSVDSDSLDVIMKKRPDIHIVIYRQGAMRPTLIELDKMSKEK